MIRANHTLHPEANSLPCSVHDPASDSIQSAMEAVLVAIASGYYTVTHFAISTNTNEFISEKLQWRQNLIALDKAFPQRDDQIVVVIDGATPELAESAAQSLTERLKRRPDLYQSVMRPEGVLISIKTAFSFSPLPISSAP